MIELFTNNPIANSSPDHIEPWGTRRDNSRNRRFNKKLYNLFPGKVLRVLDLGCSGGGFVKDCIEDGHIAVGLEGSDWSKNLCRAEWGTTKTLFTCDITKPFKLFEDGKQMKFDVITSWEVLEHIAEEDLPILLENIKDHLAPTGIFISSVSGADEWINGVKLHQSVHDKTWWIAKFYPYLKSIEGLARHFNGQYIRRDPDSFHLFMNFGFPIIIPKLFFKDKILDLWERSRVKETLKKFHKLIFQ